MIASELIAEGWHRALDHPPPDNQIVEFARDERVFRQPPWFGTWRELPLAFNVYGLFWKEA